MSTVAPKGIDRRRWIAPLLAVAGGLLLLAAVETLLRAQPLLQLGFGVTLLAPGWLRLLALLPALWLAQRGSLADFPRRQRLAALAVRAAFALALVGALARPSRDEARDASCVVALVDVSDSISDAQLATAISSVAGLRRERVLAGDRTLHLVAFAARPRRIALPDDDRAPLDADFARQLRPAAVGERGDASDLQAALQLAGGLCEDGSRRRALLLSDGIENAGGVLGEASRARATGLRVSTAPLEAGRDDEVVVHGVSLPATVRAGAPFPVVAEVYATRAVAAEVSLLRDRQPDRLAPPQRVALTAGRNLVTFRSQVEAAGIAHYRVAVAGWAADFHDRRADNNAAVASVAASGEPRVLIVEGDPPSIAPLVLALERERFHVELRGGAGLPRSAGELEPFDLVVLSDSPASQSGPSQMAALESWVSGGGGFIMLGGEASFGSGGYAGTTIERLLPLRLEGERQREQPSLALVLAIDRSGSMQADSKLDLAKEAAKATAELLGADDLIAVIAFDAQAEPLVRLQRAANRLRILADIDKLSPGGGTALLPPLDEAFRELAAAPAKVKHVILLTDGQASYDGIRARVDEMVQARITVSAVGVGAEADRTLLAMIAERGGGRFHFARDAHEIPRIFAKETAEAARSSLVERPVRARVARPAELLDGVDLEAAPLLRGYATTRPKPLAEVLLVVDNGEPLLARWRVGLGQVAAWTSDAKARWAADWMRWPGYAKLFAQLARSTMRHRALTLGAGFPISCEVDPPRVRVSIDAVGADDRFVNDLETTLEISDPAQPGKVQTVPLAQTAPGRYAGEFVLDRHGAFQLRALHRRAGRVIAESTGSVSVPYAREHLALPPDRALLERVAMIGGGAVSPRPAALFAADGEPLHAARALWPWPLWAALVLLLIDLALRRIRRPPPRH